MSCKEQEKISIVMIINKPDLVVKNAVVRIVGVFETTTKLKTTFAKFTGANYEREKISNPGSINHHKNYWYPDFRDIYFSKKEDTSAKIFSKRFDEKIDFVVRINRETNEVILLKVTLNNSELFIFKDHLNFFALDLSIENTKLGAYSDLTFCSRNFDSIVKTSDGDIKWVEWIEKNILCGIKISSDTSKGKVKVDDYSGSKFKLFTVLDLDQNLDQNERLNLLYDVGCVAPIGSAGGDGLFTPNDAYFEELMNNKISVFNNYDILPLFDSFTAIGHQILDSNPTHNNNITWTQSYFRIYLHNLFIKFNLFRYNSEMINDSVAVRTEFETFLNTYNLSHISYNFLPNLIYQKQRISLDIDSELEKFQDRINRISQSILEEKQSRSNILLGIVGLVTSLSSIEPVIKAISDLQKFSGFSGALFYSLLTILLIAVGVPLLMYLFPDKTSQLKRKWREKKK